MAEVDCHQSSYILYLRLRNAHILLLILKEKKKKASAWIDTPVHNSECLWQKRLTSRIVARWFMSSCTPQRPGSTTGPFQLNATQIRKSLENYCPVAVFPVVWYLAIFRGHLLRSWARRTVKSRKYLLQMSAVRFGVVFVLYIAAIPVKTQRECQLARFWKGYDSCGSLGQNLNLFSRPFMKASKTRGDFCHWEMVGERRTAEIRIVRLYGNSGRNVEQRAAVASGWFSTR